MKNRKTDFTIWLVLMGFYWLSQSACQTEESPPNTGLLSPSTMEVTLVASDPDIVTPIGLTIDDKDRLYVLESHTHTPGTDYSGPAFDRIKRGVDLNGDGTPDEWTIYADSLNDGMNLVASGDGIIYLVEKDKVLLIQDQNGDGKADHREILVQMSTPKDVYDHAGLLGIALGPDNLLYISRGNVGGMRYKITGSDHQYIEGFGDGGNVFRCTREGKDIEEVATGFWNPFDLKFDATGNLLLTDNDPDSRGPNRLIQIVPGGDYGYQALYGGSGIHPYLAWNGEIPGTLPFAAPLGEAPCGLIDGAFTNLPAPYNKGILVAIWEENTIVTIPLENQGKTLKGTPKIMIQGDSLFHPVSMVANSKGDLYISDWVVRQYPNHGKGKIWMVSGSDKPQVAMDTNKTLLLDSWNELDRGSTLQDLVADDPIARALARQKVRANWTAPERSELLTSEDADLRLQGVIIANETADYVSEVQLSTLLRDSLHPEIQQMSLTYTGRQGRTDMQEDLQEIFKEGYFSADLFETYLATIRHLQPDFQQGLETAQLRNEESIQRKLPDGYLENILLDESLAPSLRAHVLPLIGDRESHLPFLINQLRTSRNSDFLEGVIMSLRLINDQSASEALSTFAMDETQDEWLRSLAIAVLSYHRGTNCGKIATLLDRQYPRLSHATLHYLANCQNDEEIQPAVTSFLSKADQDFKAIWSNLTGRSDEDTKQSAHASVEDGDADIGKILFILPRSQCLTCHKVDGWGGIFGPGLSNIGHSKSKEQLISAILEPSLEMAPEWQGWFVTDAEGVTHYGRQIDVSGSGKNAEIMIQTGEFITYRNALDYGLAEASLMPDGLEIHLTEAEFGDLIAYLQSL